MLARGVCNASRSPRHASFTRDIDNRPLPLLFHARQHRLHQSNRYRQINRHYALPFIFVDSVGAAPPIAHTSTVDQHVNPSVLLPTSRNCFVYCSWFDEVGLVERECLVCVGELLWYGANVDAEDEGLSLEEETCGCETDSAAAACYDDDFVLDT